MSPHNEVWMMTRVTGISEHMVGANQLWSLPRAGLGQLFLRKLVSVYLALFPGRRRAAQIPLRVLIRTPNWKLKVLLPLLHGDGMPVDSPRSWCIRSLNALISGGIPILNPSSKDFQSVPCWQRRDAYAQGCGADCTRPSLLFTKVPSAANSGGFWAFWSVNFVVS